VSRRALEGARWSQAVSVGIIASQNRDSGGTCSPTRIPGSGPQVVGGGSSKYPRWNPFTPPGPDGPPWPAAGAPDQPATRRRAPGPRQRIAGTDVAAGVVEALRRGDPDAADQLVERYGDRVYRLAVRITGMSQDAEEAARTRC